MLFTPLHDRVLVRRIESDEKTSGGLIIPDTAKEKPQEGEVVSVGAGARDESGARIAMDVKAGDKILFGKWAGTEIKIDGEDLVHIRHFGFRVRSASQVSEGANQAEAEARF